MTRLRPIAILAALVMVAASCGSSDGTAGDTESGADADAPTVVVTTTVLGDVVQNLVGDTANVVVIMPVGADPHDFQASAQQVAEMTEADALIVNGGSFEEGLLDVIEGAESDGVAVFEALSAVETIEYNEGGDDHGDDDHGHDEDNEHGDEEHDHSDEEHADHEDEEHADHGDEDDHDHAHDHSGADPHFWTDPARMAVAAAAMADFLADEVEGIDADALQSNATSYVSELESLDGEVEEAVAALNEEDRILVTNHDSFGYLADRFGFEVIGTVIPSGTTSDGTSAQQLAELAELVAAEGVPAIFAETTESDELAQTLASEVGGDIAIVELYTGSVGESGSGAATYVEMIRTNVERIVDALGG